MIKYKCALCDALVLTDFVEDWVVLEVQEALQ